MPPAPHQKHATRAAFVLGLGMMGASALGQTAPATAAKPAAVLPYKDTSLPFDKRVADLVGRLTLEEKASEVLMAIRSGAESPEVQRLGIPPVNWWSEAIHGVSRAGSATVFPQAIAMAASWDPELMRKVGDVTATEARAKFMPDGRQYYGLTLWAPTINLARDPRWGRTEESYGEDPYLTGRLAVAFVKGLQGDDPKYLKTVATPKHFAMHSQETQRMSRSFDCPEAVLRDYYLPAFRDSFVEGKATSTMAAFSGINQVPDTANFWLLTSLLRKEWGFEGAVVTDWGGVTQLMQQQKYATTLPQAVTAAINAGVDVICDNNQAGIKSAIMQAVNEKSLKLEVLDRAVSRNLLLRFRLGMFDPPAMVAYQRIPSTMVGAKEHQALALQAALESMVLLKNDAAPRGYGFEKLLPLDLRRIDSLAVLGPYANNNLYGAYSGSPANSAPTLTAALRAAVGDRLRINTETSTDRELNIQAAQNSNMVIFTCGLNGSIEREGTDRSSLRLPDDQQTLLDAVLKANPLTIVVLVCGSPVTLQQIKDKAPAILVMWYAGEQGGVAATKLLLGQANPSGKLPITFYRANDDLPPLDDYDIRKGRTYMYLTKPAPYVFGEGISYTTYEYRNFKVTPGTVAADGTITATLDVANTGKMDGDEVVELYFHVKQSAQQRPIKQLKGFQRVSVPTGQVRHVTFTVSVADLGFWNVDAKKYVPDKGVYEFMVGASSGDIRGRGEVVVR
jgi:beta-glucosidase